MQSEADGHTYELTNVSKGETQQPIKSWGKIADKKEPVNVQVVEGLAYFPSAFNSSPVLPPCLRSRSAVSGCLFLMARSSGVIPSKEPD